MSAGSPGRPISPPADRSWIVGVCWKWVAPQGDARRGAVSPADEAALETALALADSLAGSGRGGAGDTAASVAVHVVAVAPGAATPVLRRARAAGAHQVTRVDAATDLPSSTVARLLARELAAADWVLCGDHSPDRGSGAVPAFLAAELAAAQALGLVEVLTDGRVSPGGDPLVRAVRRLDGGRRERLDVAPPAVLSVEGAAARLRRASLSAELSAGRDPLTVVTAGPGADPEPPPDSVRPFRPRPRVVAAPAGTTALERVRALTDAGATVVRGETVVLDPPQAAARILDALAEWGYLDDPPAAGDASEGSGGAHRPVA